VATLGSPLVADDSPSKLLSERTNNHVFVKVLIPTTKGKVEQKGPRIESWIKEAVKQCGQEYRAVTDWVPVQDALLSGADEQGVVWDGRLPSKRQYCPVSGDVPKRGNDRVQVSLSGWYPFAGCAANITLPDEPGSRAIGVVEIPKGKAENPHRLDEPLPCVAVIIAPPLPK
ncbi:MAG: hypothetical protein AAGG44_06710, partial [Planctomycetota bacterium]